LNVTKIEQLGSGSVYCQVIDVIHPGKVTMNKINWKAKHDYEFIANLKILQNAFDKIGIKRYVEVHKHLFKGRKTCKSQVSR
jgi:RP/EB family microtubule-associated protein